MSSVRLATTPKISKSAEAIAESLGGQKVGGRWMARCPAHDDRKPSLSIQDADDGKVLVHCHARCSQEHVIAALQSRGLWRENAYRFPKRSGSRPTVSNQPTRDEAIRTEAALTIWSATTPANGTSVETYLASRGLAFPAAAALRFHARLKHQSGGIWPAMVALVTRGVDDEPVAIHRTFLARDGSGKAPVDPQKMMLGPCRGGSVRLAPAGDVLMVGEGIETCLAAMQARDLPAWAALSTSGLLALDLPPAVRDVIVLADGDAAGDAAGRDAALRWKREGRRVRIAHPPRGLDFNDMLLGRAPISRGDM
jgi:putative DNA primase/helicase